MVNKKVERMGRFTSKEESRTKGSDVNLNISMGRLFYIQLLGLATSSFALITRVVYR